MSIMLTIVKKYIKIIAIILIVALLVFAFFVERRRFKNQILTLCGKEAVTSIMSVLNYQSLPIEKLQKLDFIDKQSLDNGKEEMAKHKAVFVGIARDNAPDLPVIMRHIEYIGDFFADYRVIIFENDSADGTKTIFNFWQILNPKVKIISKDFFTKKRPSIKFLANIRNKYLKYLKTEEYNNFDIVIPLDMDMKYGFDVRGIQDTFSKFNRWDAVCSNGVANSFGNMYDSFAFRSKDFPYSPKEYQRKTGRNYKKDGILIPSIQKIYSVQEDLIPVYSCFGGLAIYKRKLFDGCYYDAPEGDCEHVYLHKCMSSKHAAKIFMNPAQLVRYSHYTVIGK